MKLYAWGANSHGQLGVGYACEECKAPTLVTKLPPDLESSPGRVKCIVGGGGHTLLLTHDGVVFSCGWNTKGQLGFPTDKAEQNQFRKVEKLKDVKIEKVAAGWDHSLALSSDGRVFAWGSNAFSQLGVPKTKVPSHTVDPMMVDIPAPIVSVSAGLRHSAAADEAGNVHLWGSGKHGQLGLTCDGQPLPETDRPRTIAWEEEAVKVCCGQYHTAVQCRNGHVYTFGQNKFGQLCLPVQKTSSFSPCLVTEVSWVGKGKLLELFVGWTHCLAHTESGHVFTWGRGDYGQLGRSVNRNSSECDPKPGLVKLPARAVSVAVGSEHCMALLESGAVAIWGWNEHGTCGTKDASNVLSPVIVPASLKEAAVAVGCGASTSFMLVDESLPRPPKERSLLSKVANALGSTASGVVSSVPVISSDSSSSGKYSAVPGTIDSAQPGWPVGDGVDGAVALSRESGDGEALLVEIKQSGRRKPGKPFRVGSTASAKDVTVALNFRRFNA